MPRKETILWNAVPWYVGTGRKIRPVTKLDLEESKPYLSDFVALLQRLEVVVLVGKKAQRLKDHGALPTSARIMFTPHPSPLYVNRAPGNRANLTNALREVAESLGY